MTQSSITMYGTHGCGDCRRSKRVLDDLNLTYTFIDADIDLKAIDKIREINGGAESIPVIVFADGTHLTEPSAPELKAKLIALGIV